MMREPQDIKTVAVLGCGLVGFSWAVVFARHGRTVHLYNRPSPSLESVKERVRTALEFLVEEDVIDASAAQASLSRVRTFDDLAAAVTGADYVQEALPEDLELKQRVFADVAASDGRRRRHRLQLLGPDASRHRVPRDTPSRALPGRPPRQPAARDPLHGDRR